MGWSGLAIDPLEINHRLFKKFRQRDNFLRAVVTKSARDFEFFELEPYAYSTLDKERVTNLLDNEEAKIMDVHYGRSIALSDLTITMKPADPTLLCIDAEGSDFDILLGNNWENIRPRVICIEVAAASVDGEHLSDSYLAMFGYKKVHNTGLSSIYIANV